MDNDLDRPLILVTNDDGIFAPGIKMLIEEAKKVADVLVVAPDKPQSGMGHAITINNIIRLEKFDRLKFFEGVEAYSCSGTPVDCVKLAIYRILKKRPSLLLSGINHGANDSINVIYSGTMSAALEGAVEGIPSIGFSLLDTRLEADFTAAGKIAGKIIRAALSNPFPSDVCLNVNIPRLEYQSIKGIKICRQARANWEDDFAPRLDPAGKDYFWLTGKFVNHDKGEDTDVWALENNYVSIVPVQYDLTAHHAISTLNTWKYEN